MTQINGEQNGIMKLEQEFAARNQNLNPNEKGNRGVQLGILVELLVGAKENLRKAELQRVLLAVNDRSTNEFDKLLIQAFIPFLLRNGDTNDLTKLLSTRCPDYIGDFPIEFQLLATNPPIGVVCLIKAFSDTRNASNRVVILRALERGFPVLRHSRQTDAEFVSTCAKWLQDNRRKLSLNYQYPYLPSTAPRFRSESDVSNRIGLFTLGE